MHYIISSNLGPLIVGIVMILLPIPLLTGKIHRNPWYGVRIPKAFASEENWKVINMYGAKVLIFWGFWDIILIILLSHFFPANKNDRILQVIIELIPLFLAIIQILLYSRKVQQPSLNNSVK